MIFEATAFPAPVLPTTPDDMEFVDEPTVRNSQKNLNHVQWYQLIGCTDKDWRYLTQKEWKGWLFPAKAANRIKQLASPHRETIIRIIELNDQSTV